MSHFVSGERRRARSARKRAPIARTSERLLLGTPVALPLGMTRPLTPSIVGLAGALLVALAVPSCTPSDHSGPVACTGDFGASADARKLESFLLAAREFHAAAFDAEVDLRTTCRDMGVALGMSDDEIFADASSREGSVGLRAACTHVEARIDAELAAIRASSSLVVTLDARTPRCDVSVDAYASCVAECEATLDPGSIQVMCERGELRGTCNATCTGRCAIAVDAVCAGTCEGRCEGTCSARGPDGDCAGSCGGACHGQCVVSASATCAGECRGECSVRFVEPRCTGDVTAPMARADCDADCDARAAAMVMCTPGELHLAVDGTASADLRARADRLIHAYEVGGAGILELRERAAVLTRSGAVLVATAGGVPDAAASISASAVICASAAVLDVASAASSLSVSVDVSVHVSGTLSASAH